MGKLALNYMHYSTDDYVSQVNDTNISRLHERIQSVKHMKEMEERYMTGEEMLERREAKGLAEGIAEGIAQGVSLGLAKGVARMVVTFLSEKGTVPELLEDKITSEKDVEVLENWGKLAVKVSSVKEFEEQM